ncbi:hypothetical protein CU664_01975 [Pseudomonas syringae pv. actinidifoliorum]|nr:hypothetical protein [Pseudomonas syringae pv. actinidifoliorum]NAT62152.1 hypothetical protein [Pseudomonas syringae pv. actinidifoliorum]
MLRTLQRRNALRDAPRHRSAPHCTLKTGHGASRAACDAERRTIVESGGSVMTPSRASSHTGGMSRVTHHTPATRCMRIQTASQFFTPHSIPLPHCLPYYSATLAPSAPAGTILVPRLARRAMPLSLAHDFDRMA